MNQIVNKLASKPMFFELDINEPPPILTLLINPADFTQNFQKRIVQSRTRPTSRNRGAYTYQFNFDELDTMTCSGTSAMFYGERGLTTALRTQTLGYKNLKSLVEIYRNNGRNYVTRVTQTGPTLVTGGDGLIDSVGRVIIAYDDNVYRGAFDSFSINETNAKPYNLAFSFQFTVSEKIDVRNS
mgnify:CR=1 FL=1